MNGRQTIDGTLDEVLAEVRQRIRRKRESGVYGPEVDAALRAPLPGGRPLLVEELGDPLPALRDALEEEVEYDLRSRRPLIGPLITLARRVLLGLLRWWVAALGERQDRLERLTYRALLDLRERPNPAFDERLQRLEREWARFRRDLVAADLHSVEFETRFGDDERAIRAHSERFAELYRGRSRVLDLGSGRGTFLGVMREQGIGAYGVDLDRRMVATARAEGLEVEEADAIAHLRDLPSNSIDGIHARHFAEQVLPGELLDVVRQAMRALAPGSSIVFVTADPAATVSAGTFWLDPANVRPVPPELFRFYVETEGFREVSVDRLGDRDYVLIARKPFMTPAS